MEISLRNRSFLKNLAKPALVLALATPALSHAATSWKAEAGNGNWNVPENWSNGIPVSNDWAEIKTGATVTVDTEGLVAQQIFLGGNSTISQTGGTLTTSGGFAVVIGDHGVGTYNLSGGTLNLQNDWFIVGGNPDPAGTGFFNITGTGVANVTGGGIILGQDSPSSVGNLTVGGGGQVNAKQVSTFGGPGSGGTGHVTLNTGGVLSLSDNINANNGSMSLNFNGGTLRATGSNGNFVQSSVVVTVSAGGAIIDSNGNDTGFQAALTGTGNVTKIGVQQVKSAADHTLHGNVDVQQGQFTIEGGGSFTFYIGADTVSNKITGTGDFFADNGASFNFDLTSAAAVGSWTIVDISNKTYNTGFSVNGWTDAGDNVWTFGNYSFSETTGMLTAVPEPGTYAMAALGLGTLFLFRRRK